MADGILRVIGIDLERNEQLSENELAGCRAVALTGRFQWLLPSEKSGAEQREIIPISPLTAAIASIRKALKKGDVAVLASGDPLFFGIGRMLISEFGQEKVRITPAVSSLQHAFARFTLPWENAAFVSLHGRRPANLIGRLLARPLTAVLTDNVNRPEVIAQELLKFIVDSHTELTIHVAENLGMKTERCVSGSAREIAGTTFGSLCCMLIVIAQNHTAKTPYVFGLTEDEIVHSRGLITKNEVRAAVLHSLAIPGNSVLWDVGAGSGSVGLEAARMQQDIMVYSIEKEEEQQRNIQENTDRYGVANLKLIKGSAPGALAGLPRPERIFVGGSGGNLAEIIQHSATVLLPGGRIVVSAVLEKTCKEAPEVMYRNGLQVDLRRIDVERMSYPRKEPISFNPITLIVGKKTCA